MIITFIGNCQTLALCFYFQQLNQSITACWLMYGDEFLPHFDKWTNKCKNIIKEYNDSIEIIKKSDVIIYQNINIKKSLFCNTNTLRKLNKNCKLILIPSIHLVYNNFDNSIKELIKRENKNNVNIKISKILYKYKNRNIMLTCNHPTTFLFMKIMKKLCKLLNFNYFTDDQYNIFIKNNNYMELP